MNFLKTQLLPTNRYVDSILYSYLAAEYFLNHESKEDLMSSVLQNETPANLQDL
jgi:hypothetical protein